VAALLLRKNFLGKPGNRDIIFLASTILVLNSREFVKISGFSLHPSAFILSQSPMSNSTSEDKHKPRRRFDVIAFDADDTLWHNETIYIDAQERFKALLSRYHSPEWISQKLNDTEMRNLQFYGYGIKSFILSMIETGIELTEGRITGFEVQAILDIAKEMLNAKIRLFDHVQETITALASEYTLMVITKGDPIDQEAKLSRSGLEPYFHYIETVSDKTKDIYASILSKHQIEPSRFLMVGNSLRSDILPVLELGGCAVYIPYELTWAHENNIDTIGAAGYCQIEHMGLLPDILEKLCPPRKIE
jgi:putative hydrolase of the HAD superfamily